MKPRRQGSTNEAHARRRAFKAGLAAGMNRADAMRHAANTGPHVLPPGPGVQR